MNRKQRYKRRQIAKGMCRTCHTKPKGKDCSRCTECMVKHRLYERKRRGCKAWHPGGLGRPPQGGA